jgi:glycosyltransferase involved in cell wall biosynthesis
MKHPNNLESPFESHFPDHIDFLERFNTGDPIARLKAFLRSLYSFEARAKFGALLDDVKPDIVHLQNFRRHLTFSIVPEAKKRGIPVVFTAHDYDLVCPNSLLFTSDHVCEICRGKRFHRALCVRCKEHSLLGTLSIVLEGTFIRLRRYYDLIDMIITPSDFLRNKLIEFGFDSSRVTTVHNFIDSTVYEPAYDGAGVIYFGRLVAEKGLDTLIEAASRVRHVKVMIAGDGPRRSHLEGLADGLGTDNVDFLGYVERAGLVDIVRKAMCVVMPSIWYENFPYSILEAFALGKPVIASRMGGMPEIVKDGETGLLFGAGDSLALSEKMEYLHEHLEAAPQMGHKARLVVETKFNADVHYDRLMAVYKGVAGL